MGTSGGRELYKLRGDPQSLDMRDLTCGWSECCQHAASLLLSDARMSQRRKHLLCLKAEKLVAFLFFSLQCKHIEIEIHP